MKNWSFFARANILPQHCIFYYTVLHYWLLTISTNFLIKLPIFLRFSPIFFLLRIDFSVPIQWELNFAQTQKDTEIFARFSFLYHARIAFPASNGWKAESRRIIIINASRTTPHCLTNDEEMKQPVVLWAAQPTDCNQACIIIWKKIRHKFLFYADHTITMILVAVHEIGKHVIQAYTS